MWNRLLVNRFWSQNAEGKQNYIKKCVSRQLKNDNELWRAPLLFIFLCYFSKFISVYRIKIIILSPLKLNRNKLKTGKRLSVSFIAKQTAITLFKHPRDATETTIQSPQLLSKKKQQCLTNNPFVRSSLNSSYFQINSEFQMQRRVHLRLFKCIRQRTRRK